MSTSNKPFKRFFNKGEDIDSIVDLPKKDFMREAPPYKNERPRTFNKNHLKKIYVEDFHAKKNNEKVRFSSWANDDQFKNDFSVKNEDSGDERFLRKEENHDLWNERDDRESDYSKKSVTIEPNEEMPEWFEEDVSDKAKQITCDFKKVVQRSQQTANLKKILRSSPPQEDNSYASKHSVNLVENVKNSKSKTCIDSNNLNDLSFEIPHQKELNDSDDHLSSVKNQLAKALSRNSNAGGSDAKFSGKKLNNELEDDHEDEVYEKDESVSKEEEIFNMYVKENIEKIYVTKERYIIHKDSLNGFSRSKIDTYLQIPKKVFSFYMFKGIFAPVWVYKDNLKNILGAFMSYDMDLWNSEKDYFSPNLMISYQGNNFYPIADYIGRKSHIREMFPVLELNEEEIERLGGAANSSVSTRFLNNKKEGDFEPSQKANQEFSQNSSSTINKRKKVFAQPNYVRRKEENFQKFEESLHPPDKQPNTNRAQNRLENPKNTFGLA